MSSTIDVSPTAPAAPAPAPPFSRALRIAAGICLIAGGVLNGLPQFVGTLLAGGDLDFGEMIVWGADHPFWRVEQMALLASSLFMPLGLLGVAHVCRFRAPVLTAVATPLVLWGMWGFTVVLALSYVAGTVAPSALSVPDAVALDAAYGTDAGAVGMALVPHLVGSFLGLLLLGAAAWRSQAFPRPAVLLLVAFLLWDFLLGSLPVDSGLLLVLAWGWMGIHLIRMPDAIWRGAGPR